MSIENHTSTHKSLPDAEASLDGRTVKGPSTAWPSAPRRDPLARGARGRSRSVLQRDRSRHFGRKSPRERDDRDGRGGDEREAENRAEQAERGDDGVVDRVG